MNETPHSPPSCDEELKAAVDAWRKEHHLPEDDAVLLLVDLFKIHQNHWEALRRKDFPAFEPLRNDIQALTTTNQSLRAQAKTLSARFAKLSNLKPTATITRTAAWIAAVAGFLAGGILGRLLPWH